MNYHEPMKIAVNMSNTFLIVDDDTVFTRILARALKRHGIQSLIAHNQAGALTQYSQALAKPNHAIIDLNMGEDSGLDLIPKLLSYDPQLKIIVLTGYSSIATTVEAMKLGAVNYLCKPASIDEIMRAFVDRNDNSMQQKENKIEPKRPSVERLEWEYIQKTLAENDGNISATARTLGMHRRTLQRKLQKKPVRS